MRAMGLASAQCPTLPRAGACSERAHPESPPSMFAGIAEVPRARDELSRYRDVVSWVPSSGYGIHTPGNKG